MDAGNPKIRIALDAMGGDFAPGNVIAGALEAMEMSGDRFEIVLVGPETRLKSELRHFSANESRFTFAQASEVINMDDAATAGVKQKRDSSISVGMMLHKEGKVDAFVSAGHSGAVMSTATLILGRIEGIGRPTIGTFFPTTRGVCLLLDAGANVDCKPQHLFEFALMGSIYTREMLGIDRPTIGLLNIGEEESKGNELVKEANKLIKESQLNFAGNVEGRGILSGDVDVVVCDGFVGNVLLKFGESVPSFFKHQLKKVVNQNILYKLTGLLMRGTLKKAFKSMDYEEFGGVPLLGVNGVTIIGHGKSTPKALRNMIFRAEEMARKKINRRIQEALTK